MAEMSDRTYRRAEQAAALVYPIAILAVLGLALDVSPSHPMGGGFFVLYAVKFGIMPAAFATGLLVLVVNGVYGAQGGSSDRLNTILAGIMVVTIPPLWYPYVYSREVVPELLVIFIVPVAFVVGPAAILVHSFRLPTRFTTALSVSGGNNGRTSDS